MKLKINEVRTKLKEYRFKKILLKLDEERLKTIPEEQREDLEERIREKREEIESLNKWLEEQEEHIRKIIIIRFINGRSWKDTSRAIYGEYSNPETIRKEIYRYFKKLEKKEKEGKLNHEKI